MGGQAAERSAGKLVAAQDGLRETWTKVAQRLRAELGDDLFNSWFGRMEPEGFVDGVLVASVPTRFLKSWIENHYAAKLTKIAGAEFAGLRQVQVRVRVQGVTAQSGSVPRAIVNLPRSEGRHAEPSSLQPMAGFMPQAAEAALARATVIDESQTFDSFMIGQSNQLAHAAAMRVANSPTGTPVGFNPLYIHAGAGLGNHLAPIGMVGLGELGKETHQRAVCRVLHFVGQLDAVGLLPAAEKHFGATDDMAQQLLDAVLRHGQVRFDGLAGLDGLGAAGHAMGVQRFLCCDLRGDGLLQFFMVQAGQVAEQHRAVDTGGTGVVQHRLLVVAPAVTQPQGDIVVSACRPR